INCDETTIQYPYFACKRRRGSPRKSSLQGYPFQRRHELARPDRRRASHTVSRVKWEQVCPQCRRRVLRETSACRGQAERPLSAQSQTDRVDFPAPQPSALLCAYEPWEKCVRTSTVFGGGTDFGQ